MVWMESLLHSFTSKKCDKLLTTVCVDVVRLQKANSEVMKDRRFMQVAESGEVIFPHQDVWVTEERKRLAFCAHCILQRLIRHTPELISVLGFLKLTLF